MLQLALRAYNFRKRKKKDSYDAGCGAKAVKVFGQNSWGLVATIVWKRMLIWDGFWKIATIFFKTHGLDLDSRNVAGDGNNRLLQTFLFFYCSGFNFWSAKRELQWFCQQVIASKNAVAFKRADSEVERGGWCKSTLPWAWVRATTTWHTQGWRSFWSCGKGKGNKWLKLFKVGVQLCILQLSQFVGWGC